MVPGECRGCKAGLSTVSVRGVLKHWWPDDNGELEDCADSGLKEPKKVLLEEACALLENGLLHADEYLQLRQAARQAWARLVKALQEEES